MNNIICILMVSPMRFLIGNALRNVSPFGSRVFKILVFRSYVFLKLNAVIILKTTTNFLPGLRMRGSKTV